MRRDFGDDLVGDAPSGLAATEVLVQPAARNLVTGLSENPLDDLVSIFGGANMGMGGMGGSPMGAFGGSAFGGLPTPAPVQSPASSSALSPPTQSQQPQEDLLGLF